MSKLSHIQIQLKRLIHNDNNDLFILPVLFHLGCQTYRYAIFCPKIFSWNDNIEHEHILNLSKRVYSSDFVTITLRYLFIGHVSLRLNIDLVALLLYCTW